MGCGALIFRLKSAAKDLRTLMDTKGLVTLLFPCSLETLLTIIVNDFIALNLYLYAILIILPFLWDF